MTLNDNNNTTYPTNRLDLELMENMIKNNNKI